MKKLLTRLAYWVGLPPDTSRAYHVSPTGQLVYRRWINAADAAPLERPVAHFSDTGQLLVHQ